MYSNELILQILDYLNDNINKKVSLVELSQKFSYNKDYIMRIFKRELNKTIVDYMNERRIYNSLKELETTNDSIIKVALNNGFYSQEYFSEIFVKTLGVKPTTYRKFTKITSNITQKELDTIRKNLPLLFNSIEKIDAYQRNKKGIEKKVLSLFH